MNRVVVTGLGIVSSLGNGVDRVVESLRGGRSGMVFMPEMRELGYKCCVCAPVVEPDTSVLPGKLVRSMAPCAVYAMLAAREAVCDAGLSAADLQSESAGVVVGSGAGGVSQVPLVEDALAAGRKPSELGAVGIVKIMNATAAAHLATFFGTKGRTCSISSACTSGLYNIGHAYELLKYGMLDLCICGASEEETWKQVGLSADNCDGMPADWNSWPSRACRPYDRDRQGFVGSAGAGIFVLETLARAERRGARAYAEVVGYGAANDACDMFRPNGDGLRRSIEESLGAASRVGVDEIDYINSHGPGTLAGDVVDVEVIRTVFGTGPMVSSTKGHGGHGQGAAGALEAVHTVLMLDRGFVAPTANLENVAPDCGGIQHVQVLEQRPLKTALTFNSGLGGTNASLILRRF